MLDCVQGDRFRWTSCVLLAVALGAAASGCGRSHSPRSAPDAGAPDGDAGGAGDASVAEGASCEVDGVVYDDGSTDIDDPFSCNTCQCDDGSLVCTEIACPEPCPEDTAPGTSCSQCGPADACEVVRTDCHPTCETEADCTDPDLPFCFPDEGVCTMACG